MKPFLIAVPVGLLLAFAATVGVAWFGLGKRQEDARLGWNLKPVLVAARKLEQGTTVADGMLKEKQLPEQFVDGALTPAELGALRGAELGVTLNEGDVISWAAFMRPALRKMTSACIEAVRKPATDAQETAEGEALAAFVARAGKPLPDPDPVPDLPAADANGEIEVVVAAEDISEGTVVERSMLAVRKLPARFLTRSDIPGSDGERIAGARIGVPVLKGDPLLWQFLDSANAPRTEASCNLATRTAGEKALSAAAAQAAKEFMSAQAVKP